MKYTIDNILKYYKENPGCDPNMYEFIKLSDDLTEYLIDNQFESQRKANIQDTHDYKLYSNYLNLAKLFEEKLLGNDLEITEESPLYQLYREAVQDVDGFVKHDDTKLRSKLGAVALFIAQKNREVRQGLIDSFTYDNSREFMEITYMHYRNSDLREDSPKYSLYEQISKEYNKNYQEQKNDDPKLNELKSTIDNILNYYNSNPECDPNISEFITLSDNLTKHLIVNRENPNYHIIAGNYLNLAKLFGEKLLGNDLEITEDSPLYQLYRNTVQDVEEFIVHDDTELRAKLGGVSLFIAQKNREVRQGLIDSFTYSNAVEFMQIKDMNNQYFDLREDAPRYALYDEISREFQKDFGRGM